MEWESESTVSCLGYMCGLGVRLCGDIGQLAGSEGAHALDMFAAYRAAHALRRAGEHLEAAVHAAGPVVVLDDLDFDLRAKREDDELAGTGCA